MRKSAIKGRLYYVTENYSNIPMALISESVRSVFCRCRFFLENLHFVQAAVNMRVLVVAMPISKVADDGYAHSAESRLYLARKKIIRG